MKAVNYSKILIFLLLNIVYGNKYKEVKTANEYMDSLLRSLRNDPVITSKVEPIHVPDVYQANFQARNIYIRGLSDLTRLGDSLVGTKQDYVYIRTKLGVNKMKFIMDFTFKKPFLPIWISGKAKGKIDNVIVQCLIAISKSDGIGYLKEFKVTDFGEFSIIEVKGNTIIPNFIIKIKANIMFIHSKTMVIRGLEDSVSKLLEEKLSEVNISPRNSMNQQ